VYSQKSEFRVSSNHPKIGQGRRDVIGTDLTRYSMRTLILHIRGIDSRLVVCIDGKGCAHSRARGPQPVWQGFTPLRFVVAHRLALGAQGVVSRIRDPCRSWTERIFRSSPCIKEMLAA
jgi:hypothetical protein